MSKSMGSCFRLNSDSPFDQWWKVDMSLLYMILGGYIDAVNDGKLCLMYALGHC